MKNRTDVAGYFLSPQPGLWPAWLRYGVAVACVAAGGLGRAALSSAVGPTALPFVFFFPLIAIAAWLGGLGPGLLALALSALVADYFFFEPLYSLAIHGSEVWAFLTFAMAGIVIVAAIHAMHLAKAGLTRSRDLLTTTLTSIGDGVIVTDGKGRVTFLNPEAERLTKWTAADAVGQPLSAVFKIMNEQTRKPAESPVDKALGQGVVVGLANHTVLVARDGTELPIDDSAAPIRDPGGPVVGVVLVFRDATVQRKADADHARLATIVDHSEDIILSKTLDGNILTWNAAAQRLFSYRADEIVGKPVTTLIPPELQHEERQILERIRRGERVERFETVRVAKDGRRIPVSLSVSPIKDPEGRIIGASKILHDITEVLAAREALNREKELLRTTLASIGDGVIVTDDRGRISFLNPEAERLTGWTSTESRGRPLPEIFRIVNEESRNSVENPVDKVLREGTVVGLANHTLLISRSGAQIPIDDSAAPIRDPGGPLFGVVLVFRDFTERRKAESETKQAQEELARVNASLERAVQERTAKLREMIDELQQVSYAITHDMRAPLRAMSSFAELLAESAGNLPEESQGYCRRIIAGAGRLDLLIQDALNYSKAVLQELPLAPVDLSKVLRGILETYPNLQPDKADIRIEGALPVLIGNESLLTQCFSNLLGNAVKFVAPGVHPSVRIRSESKSPIARIWVEDNGIGIPAHAQPRLFGMFQKLDNQYEGTGIGLAIVRKVVERMGGAVGVESEPGKGSRFWVELRQAP